MKENDSKKLRASRVAFTKAWTILFSAGRKIEKSKHEYDRAVENFRDAIKRHEKARLRMKEAEK